MLSRPHDWRSVIDPGIRQVLGNFLERRNYRGSVNAVTDIDEGRDLFRISLQKRPGVFRTFTLASLDDLRQNRVPLRECVEGILREFLKVPNRKSRMRARDRLRSALRPTEGNIARFERLYPELPE